MGWDWNKPLGPNECKKCPGQYHWPWQCRRGETDAAFAELEKSLAKLKDAKDKLKAKP